MSEEKITSGIETDGAFRRQVMGEIGSLRDQLATIQQLLERGHSADRAIDEYRYLPSDLKKPIRWGYIGAWGEGGSNCVYNIITTTEDDYFDKPHSSDEIVAGFAAVFSHPNTIGICKYLFREEGRTREEIKKGCGLSDEELDAAVEPLLEWHFAEWKDGMLEGVEHGVHYAVTLVGMAQVAIDSKARREQGKPA
jgi:hypothetical protein